MQIRSRKSFLLIARNSSEERVRAAEREHIKRPAVSSTSALGFRIISETLVLVDLKTRNVSSKDWLVINREILQELGIYFFAG